MQHTYMLDVLDGRLCEKTAPQQMLFQIILSLQQHLRSSMSRAIVFDRTVQQHKEST
jgi:hypothetical protein